MASILTVLQEFIQILVGGVVSMGTGIAGGIVATVKALFLEVNAETGAITGLGVFGGLIAMFAAIALAVGLTTKVFIWVTSLGR